VNVLFEVPDLLVGFDIESTGLDTRNDEAISYGFAEFQSGLLSKIEQFFVLPDVQIHPGAEKIHGVSFEVLRRLHRQGDALSARAGATRATQRLLDYASRGAAFVGANPMFDYSMLDATLKRQGVGDLATFGFKLDEITVIDVVSHDRAVDEDRVARPRRGLSNLCEHYGVVPGCHDAAQDARAAVEVLLAQIALVNERQPSERSSSRTAIDLGEAMSLEHTSWLRRAMLRIR